MGYWVLRCFTYVFLVVGVLYMSWHLGRSFERTGADEAAAFVEPESLECESLRAEIRDYRRLYTEVLDELQAPSGKQYWDGKYMEYTKR